MSLVVLINWGFVLVIINEHVYFAHVMANHCMEKSILQKVLQQLQFVRFSDQAASLKKKCQDFILLIKVCFFFDTGTISTMSEMIGLNTKPLSLFSSPLS